MQETAEKVSTTLGLHQQNAEKMNAVIKTMTGEAIEWNVSHGHYLSLCPVTNMNKVEFNFYSMHVRSWGDRLTEDEMAQLRATLKKARRWKYKLVKDE